jgi:hypothetical protein
MKKPNHEWVIPIIIEYKDVLMTNHLDDDHIDNLCKSIKNLINGHEGNLTDEDRVDDQTWIDIIAPIINHYRGEDEDEPLCGDEVDKLCYDMEDFIREYEGEM